MTLNPPFVGGTNYVNTAVPQQINRTLDQGLPITDPFIPISNPSGGINVFHPDNVVGYLQQRSISLQRELSEGLLFDVTYVGNYGLHLYDAYDLNQAVPGTGSAQERRPYFAIAPNLTAFTYKEQRARSYYDALQISLTKRFSSGFSFLTNYTWSHAIEIPGFQGGGHQNARDLDADRSNSGNDLRHRFVINWLYELPFGPGKPYLGNSSTIVKGLVAGWQVGSVTIIQSGSPYNITGGAGRPNRTCDGRLKSGRTVEKWFDTSCFTLPAAVPDPIRGGSYVPFGNSGTYLLPGPAFINFDISLFKSFNISEAKRFEFRSEFFNAFNHPQFLNPSATVNTGTFGRIVNARPARQIQMVLKFVF